MSSVALKKEFFFFSIVQEVTEKSYNQFHWELPIKIRENTINMVLNKVESCAKALRWKYLWENKAVRNNILYHVLTYCIHPSGGGYISDVN